MAKESIIEKMNLNNFNNTTFDRGASSFKEILWTILGDTLVSSRIPGTYWRVKMLRLFGSNIGQGVTLKPSIHIKFPWRLNIGDYSWIGERVWIDNLNVVYIGQNVCISQGVYICTGSHNWSKKTFDLITKVIVIKNHVWIGAFSKIAPGVLIGEGAVITLGGVAIGTFLPWSINSGNPAKFIKKRKIC